MAGSLIQQDGEPVLLICWNDDVELTIGIQVDEQWRRRHRRDGGVIGGCNISGGEVEVPIIFEPEKFIFSGLRQYNVNVSIRIYVTHCRRSRETGHFK